MSSFNRNYERHSVLTGEPDGAIDREEDFESVYRKYMEKMARIMESQGRMDAIHNYKIKNKIPPKKEADQKEEKIRKTRKDKEGRKFVCGGCKLGYLSYPALYTHIKTKHGGIAPDETIRGESGKPKKRGRPKVRKTPQIYERELQKNEFPKDLCGLIKKDYLEITEQYQYDVVDQPAEITAKQFISLVRQLKKANSSKIYLLPIDKLIATFLFNLKDIIDSPSLQSFQEIFLEFIQFVNSNYSKILKDFQEITNCYVNQDLQKTEVYCSCETALFVPVFVEKYIQHKLDPEDDMGQLMLFDFVRWLNDLELTDIKLSKHIGVNSE